MHQATLKLLDTLRQHMRLDEAKDAHALCELRQHGVVDHADPGRRPATERPAATWHASAAGRIRRRLFLGRLPVDRDLAEQGRRRQRRQPRSGLTGRHGRKPGGSSQCESLRFHDRRNRNNRFARPAHPFQPPAERRVASDLRPMVYLGQGGSFGDLRRTRRREVSRSVERRNSFRFPLSEEMLDAVIKVRSSDCPSSCSINRPKGSASRPRAISKSSSTSSW